MTADEVAWSYFHGAAGDGTVLARNVAAWREWSIVPRMFRTPARVDASAEVLGIRSSFPLWIAPSAAHALGHPEGEVATARIAGAAGVPIVLSQAASTDVEDVAAAATTPYLQQIYLPEDRPAIEPFLERVVNAGARALVLTLDQPGTAYQHPFRRLGAGWSAGGRPRLAPLPAGQPGAVGVRPDDIGWLARLSGLPVLAKGVLHPGDARIAVDAGASGVVVSNHGGRQSGGTISAAHARPGVAAEIDGAVPVRVDSGISDADDVFRALALGADGVLSSRSLIGTLWREGEDAAAAHLRELRDGFEHLLVLTGHPDPASVRADGTASLFRAT